MIQAEAASLVYLDHGKPVYACRDVDLSIAPGEFVGILGPSGSGKSSLLYLLSGLKTPTSGTIRYNGASISAMPDPERARLRLREFGFVFQQSFLLGYLTALENVALGQGDTGSTDEAMRLLCELGLEDKSRRLPHELSGGERQRVCVARAMMGSPKIVFADEPTAALDHTNGVHVIQALNDHRGAGSLVMVTHDPSTLERADRVLHIVDGALTQGSTA